MAYNKVSKYEDSESILDSEIGLVTKTCQANKSMASTVDSRDVIKAGTLYDDSTDTYTAVTPEGTENPTTEGWYEKDGTTYTLSEDTSVNDDKTYYKKTRTASSVYGVVFRDYDITDYDDKPIAVVVAGRLLESKVSSEAVAAKSTLAAQGIYLV